MVNLNISKGSWLKVKFQPTDPMLLTKVEDFEKLQDGSVVVRLYVAFNYDAGRELSNMLNVTSNELRAATHLSLTDDRPTAAHEDNGDDEDDEDDEVADEGYENEEDDFADENEDGEDERVHYPSVTAYTEVSRRYTADKKDFGLPLGSGETKSLLLLADQTLDNVWPEVDAAINESGHQFTRLMKPDLVFRVIEAKIEDLSNFDEIDILSQEWYSINHRPSNQVVRAKHLGKSLWFVHPDDRSGVGGFVEGKPTIIINDTATYRNLIISKMVDFDSSEINLDEVNPDIGSPETLRVTHFSPHVVKEISGDSIGKGWVQTLTHYYLTTGKFSWVVFDTTTFETAKVFERQGTLC